MLNSMTLKNTRWATYLQEKTGILLKAFCDFKEKHKAHIMNCAVIYMSVKIGLILLATFATMVLLISYVSQHLAMEMTKTKSLLFASPLTLIVMLKLYFIFKMLMTYDRSRMIIKSIIRVVSLKGKKGMQRIEETFPVGAPPLSLEKVKNC
ncbi:MAG: hypothetical protein HYV59_06535 [Planctomycetes bacterium]|nr:hypothetical protein [Planctomycetota bacterium]